MGKLTKNTMTKTKHNGPVLAAPAPPSVGSALGLQKGEETGGLYDLRVNNEGKLVASIESVSENECVSEGVDEGEGEWGTGAAEKPGSCCNCCC